MNHNASRAKRLAGGGPLERRVRAHSLAEIRLLPTEGSPLCAAYATSMNARTKSQW